MHTTQVLRAAALMLGVTLFAPNAFGTALATLDGAAPIVIAHRGASGYLPEHTLGGYELAIQLGADYIEPDLQFTSDGELVAMHDSTLNRTTNIEALFAPRNGGYAVSDFSLAEIKTLTVTPTGTGSTSYPGFTPASGNPYRIPTFQEVLTLAAAQSALTGRTIGVYPEAKQADPAMEDAILSTLQANGYSSASHSVFIQSFSSNTIMSMHAKQEAQGTDMRLVVLGAAVTVGGVPMLGVTDVAGGVISLEDIALFADGVGVVIGVAAYEITQDFIDAAHAAGLLVHGWTFAKIDPALAAAEYEHYLALGMDGVFSNYTDLAVEARDAFVAQVPEPGVLSLFGAGLAGLVALRRRNRAPRHEVACAG
jgi:glycerophosphoryl diester phosphodiesterase